MKYDDTIQQIFSVLSQDIDKISGDTVLHQEALSLLEKHAPEFKRFEQAVGIMLQLFKQIPADQWQLDVREKGYYYYRSTSTIIDLDVIETFVDRCWSDYTTYGEYVKMLAINEELTKRMKNESYKPNVYNLSLFQYLDAMKVGLFTQDHLFEAIFTNTLASEIFIEPTKLRERYQQSFEDLTDFFTIREQAIDRILAIELKRGDTPTAVTKLASSISYFEGINYFLQILQALDGEKLARGYIWQAETKRMYSPDC